MHSPLPAYGNWETSEQGTFVRWTNAFFFFFGLEGSEMVYRGVNKVLLCSFLFRFLMQIVRVR